MKNLFFGYIAANGKRLLIEAILEWLQEDFIPLCQKVQTQLIRKLMEVKNDAKKLES